MQFCIMIGYNLDPIDPIMAKIELLILIGSGYDLESIEPIIMGIDICNRMGYNYDTIYQITVGIDVYCILNEMVLVDFLIKISILTSFLDTLIIVFDEINSNMDKLSEFECEYVNNIYLDIIITHRNKISVAAPAVGFFLAVFFVQAMHDSSLNITILIEFESIINCCTCTISIKFSCTIVYGFSLL